MKMFKNKRGATVDNIFVVVTFFGLVIFFLAVMTAWSFIANINEDLWDLSSKGPQIKANGQSAIDTFDFILITVYLGLHLGILATVFLLRTHPIVYIAAIFIIAILALVAAPLSNAYDEIVSDEVISTVAGDIPMTNFIMEQLPRMEIIWAFVTAIVLFGMARREDII